jgi:hypothetical protein
MTHGEFAGVVARALCRAQSRHRVTAGADTRRLRLGVHAAGGESFRIAVE